MIELSQPIVTSDGVLVPAGVRLDFKGGKAKYQNHPILRALVPLQCIVGGKGPFLNACCATVLNDNRGFQQAYNKQFKDWAHCVIFGDYLIIYIWDTRQVIDVIPGIHQATQGGSIQKRLINKKTGEVIAKTIGYAKWGWAKSLYEMMMWPAYHRMDNGLPLVCKDSGWQEIIDKFNAPIKKTYAYESLEDFEDDARAAKADREKNLAVRTKTGWTMPNGSYPINNAEDIADAANLVGHSKDYSYEQVKNYIMYCARHLDRLDKLPKSWQAELAKERGLEAVIGQTFKVSVVRYTPGMQSWCRKAVKCDLKSEPWMHFGFTLNSRKPQWAIWIWDTRQVLASGELTPEQVRELMQINWNHKDSAIDNGRPLHGGNVAEINRCFGHQAATEAWWPSDIHIVPSTTANQHNVFKGDVMVGTVSAAKLEQVAQGYAKPTKQDNEDAGETENDTTDQYTELHDSIAYKNTDDNKLVVKDNDSNVIDLACLSEDIVPESLLLKELSEHFA